VARLAGIQGPLGALQGVVAGQAIRFVQQQDTVEHLPASGSHRS
jgi:methyl coenzyme M reductase gamma subunit